MLYRIKPQNRLELDLQGIVTLEKPEGIHLIFYGFNAMHYALTTLHPEGVSQSMEGEFRRLTLKTDTDLMICPSNQKLINLQQGSALDYYLAVQKKMRNVGWTEFIPMSQTSFSFLGFEHDNHDCSLQAKPLAEHLYSSCQAFYDLHSDEFIFLDATCYHYFLHRMIYTPTLEHLFEKGKQNNIIFKTLIFNLVNMLKFRHLGWTLSEHDRRIISQINFNHEYGKRINKALQEATGELFYIQTLKEQLTHDAVDLTLILKKREVEALEYIVYSPHKNIQTLVEDLEWLQKQITCPSHEKNLITESYCESFLMDRTRSDAERQKFIELISETSIVDQCAILKKLKSKKTESSSTSSSSTLLFSHHANTTQHEPISPYQEHHFENRPRTSPKEKKNFEAVNKELIEKSSKAFEKEFNESGFRLTMFLGLIPSLHLSFQNRREQDPDDLTSPIINVFLMGFVGMMFVNGLSRFSYNYIFDEHGRDLYVLEALSALSQLHDQRPVDAQQSFLLIMASLRGLLMMKSSPAHLETLFSDAIKNKSDLFSLKNIKLKNVKAILRSLNDILTDNRKLTSFDIIIYLFLLTQTFKVKSEDLFTKTLEHPISTDKIAEGLENKINTEFEQIKKHVQKSREINESFKNILSQYFQHCLQLSIIKPMQADLKVFNDFHHKISHDSYDDTDLLYQYYLDPFNLFIKTQENREALVQNLIELSSNQQRLSPFQHAL